MQKTCSTCKAKKLRQRSNKRSTPEPVNEANTTFEGFLTTLKTMDEDDTAFESCSIDINGFLLEKPSTPTEIAKLIADSVYESTGFKFM